MSDLTVVPDADEAPGTTKPVLSLRDKILAADDISVRVEDVPEWGVRIAFRTMTGATRAAMLGEALDAETGQMNFATLYPSILVATAEDPETGAKVFTHADLDLLNQKSGAVIERLAKVGMEVSGLDAKAEDREGKD